MAAAGPIDYTSQAWSCRHFDEAECQRQVVRSLQESHNTIYAVLFVPPAAAGGRDGLLLAAYHSGDVRLFDWHQLCGAWLSARAQQREQLSWRAHDGPAYAAVLLPLAGVQLLATAGDDGRVRLWRLADVLAAAAAAAEGQPGAAASAPPQAAAEVLLPHLLNPIGISDGSQPAAQALAADAAHGQLFVGASDGGVHAWRLGQLGPALAAGAVPSAVAAAALQAMPGHAAGVLGLDYSPGTHKLASASEDGTVRLWDGDSLACSSTISPWEEIIVPPGQPFEQLRCVKAAPMLCVRFDACGRWLLAGSGAGTLTLWNVETNTVARHKNNAKCVPQALLLEPGSVYVAGTDRRLHEYTFLLEEVRALDVGPESVFGLARHAASGMLAVAGARGCLDLLTPEGACRGSVRPPRSVLVPAGGAGGSGGTGQAGGTGGASSGKTRK